MSTIVLAHLNYYDPVAGTEATWRGCSGTGFVTGNDAAYRPPGVAAHIAYEPRIIQPALMRRDCFSRGATGGASEVGVGEMILANVDGALDAWPDYGFDGRAVELIVGTAKPNAPPTWTTVIRGTMEQPRFSLDQVAIRLRDRQAELDVPAAPKRYGGTNELPDGLDGTGADLQGKPVPRCWGVVFNVPAPCVNTSRLIYQLNDGAVASVDAAYDRGAALTKGADYADQAAMETTAPAAGTFRAWPGGGYARLGSTPAGQITFDVTAAVASAGQVAYAIATGPGAIATADVISADITTLDVANGATVGLWVDGDTSCRAALDAVCGSVGAWWGFDRVGKLRVGRIGAPGGAAAFVLDQDNIESIERVATADAGAGVPAWRGTLSYKRRWLTQDSDLAGSVSDARRAELREPWAKVTVEAPTTRLIHPLAPELEWESLLIDPAAASAEAASRLTMYSVRRDRYEVRVSLDADIGLAVDIGAVVLLVWDRYGMGAGKPMIVIGLQADLRANSYSLTLWG